MNIQYEQVDLPLHTTVLYLEIDQPSSKCGTACYAAEQLPLVPDQSEEHMFAVRNDRAGRDVICVALFLVKNKQLDDVEARLRAKCLNLRFTFTDCTHSPEERADRRHHSACILCKVSPNLLRVLTAAAPSFS